ncbi:MAG: M15 family metallopeptidase [Lachnospiraceae bacterium]|jgi:hypothetical protein|nr:M15 family metallopeptidase [Lachnospiraceae bacterium]
MDSSEKKKIIMIIIACVILFTAAGSAVGLLILQKKQMDDMAQKHEKMMEELERMQENQEPGIREDTPDGNDEAAETEAAETNPIEIEPEGTKAAETKAAETGPAFLESLSGLSPGTVLSEEELDFDNLDQYFMVWEIEEGDNLYERINGKSYKKNDYVPLESLRYLKMPHYNFDGQIQVGEMIVSQDILEDVFAIFKELFQHKYQIQSMYLVDNYWTGDPDTTDSASIDVNNTSAFCFRMATGSGHLSNHAYGKAIDINPQQNPYVSYSTGEPKWAHSNADPYIDRTTGLPHVITHDDLAFKLFKERGFRWGGDWNNPKDYQHFDKN